MYKQPLQRLMKIFKPKQIRKYFVEIGVCVPRFFLLNIIIKFNRNKNQIDELKQANELKLQDLQKRLEDNDATLKSHRRELEVFRN